MKKIFILLPLLATLAILTACSTKEENRESVRLPENIANQTKVSLLTAESLKEESDSPTYSYWYECDYYGVCWDSEDYTWYDCYYNAFSKNCAEGNYWKGTEPFEESDEEPSEESDNITTEKPSSNPPETGKSCCDSWGNCYDENSQEYADPAYLKVDYCDECGNCYDYYGNYVNYDKNSVDPYWCEKYYQYEKVSEWDVCGNAYDDFGNFLFYDNYYYDFQACNNNYTTYCGDDIGGPDPSNATNNGTNGTEESIEPKTNVGDISDYCDECGNCYDYYGNSLGYDETYYDEYWCGQYYQYDKVKEWDTCGNAYDEAGNFLFYDNKYYDYRACHNDYSSSPSQATPSGNVKLNKDQRQYTSYNN